MFRRKRRNQGTWFPMLGTGFGEPGAQEDNYSGRQATITVPNSGSSVTLITDLTHDVPLEGDGLAPDVAGQLPGALGSEYFIKRIVGKIVVASFLGEGERPPGTVVGVGLFVARADDSQTVAGASQPVGAASADERQENYNVLSEDTIRAPWIWRRVWFLRSRIFPRDAVAGVTQMTEEATFPANNLEYGSVMDGPHIDAKTRRRVGRDERLWLSVSARSVPIGTTSAAGSEIRLYTDLRMFAQLVKARNKGSF